MKSDKSILLVEDDKVDVMTVKRALKEIRVTNKVYVVGNGEEALTFLHEPSNERPAIILLDINMPKMNGIEFLKVAKNDEEIKRIPTIVLTTSRDDWDRVQSFDLGAAGYMIKPVDYLQFVEVMRTIDMYWSLSEMP
ncbi:response regulator receiver protein [Chloroherpeton thalassium ATCC 35110]|uniref:Response regulator receiver protein n=1 Tax=Chloroherpeton thalassium (strain ATCC 35110 / GB-78) TaxID=517418 RepID=B3QSA1_CHLT3|nr:response regulator [Chloroherpeton thalassium]ACF12492.1 response regulator receiver protein [Chloroherpeton thalassium ATCC 35110]